MLINNSLFLPIAIGAAFLIALGLFWLLKYKLDIKKASLAAILGGVLFYVLVPGTCGKLYVVDENFQVKYYRTIGRFNFEFTNKIPISDAVAMDKVGIINNSSKKLVVEEIVYAQTPITMVDAATGNYKLDAYSYQLIFLPQGTIDFFFNDPIPETIDDGYSMKSMYWMHEMVPKTN